MKPLENNNKVILMVDDELDILELFGECLRSEGYNVQLFTEPSELLKYFYENPNCSVVITDYKMPEMGGIDLIRKIREIDKEFKIKLILISAYLEDGITSSYSTNELENLKIDKILEKPLKITELTNIVKKLIEIEAPAV
ncbi:MAG TPA: response regulator [Nitrososphaeraceae archaeon]|nr:response regulator [Nitrososphaeraceae archaeon]